MKENLLQNKESNDEYKNMIEDLNEKINDLTFQIDGLNKDKKRYEEQIKKLQSQTNLLQKENKEKEEALNKLKDENEELQNIVSNLSENKKQ